MTIAEIQALSEWEYSFQKKEAKTLLQKMEWVEKIKREGWTLLSEKEAEEVVNSLPDYETVSTSEGVKYTNFKGHLTHTGWEEDPWDYDQWTEGDPHIGLRGTPAWRGPEGQIMMCPHNEGSEFRLFVIPQKSL